jgi:hypothetical protein
VSGAQLDTRLESLGTVPETTPDTLAAAERYIRRRARDEEDAEVLVDALLGPLATKSAGRDGLRLRSKQVKP